jgi:hypothetical protein
LSSSGFTTATTPLSEGQKHMQTTEENGSKKYHHPKWHHRQSILQMASYREVKINLCLTLDELEINAIAIPFVACRQGKQIKL